MSAKAPDSPVYHHLPALLQPNLSDEQFDRAVDATETRECRLSSLIKEGKEASAESRHDVAAVAFEAAHNLSPEEPYLIQQWALATYKSNAPSEEKALREGLKIISELNPDNSNDPESLGITGAMYKRLWLLNRNPDDLDRAITYYRRGFEIRRDYYNGENLAVCYDFRADVQREKAEADYDRKTAYKVREAVVIILSEVIRSPFFADRTDRKWVYASLANCNFALGNDGTADHFEGLFKGEGPADWEVETYEAGKAAVLGK